MPSNKRRMQEIDDKDANSLLTFEPSISNYNSSLIDIDFNFISKKKLQMNEILTYGIYIKEPMILRTKSTYTAFTTESFKDNDIF